MTGKLNFPERQTELEKPTSKFTLPTAPAPRMYVGRGTRRRPYIFIEPPAVLSLRQNYDEVAKFFQHLRHQIYRSKAEGELGRAIDFAALRSVSPSAGLVLSAELFRWQQFTARRLLAVKSDKWDATVRQTLRDLGLFDFLRTPNMQAERASIAADPLVSLLKYRKGNIVDGAGCYDLLEHLSEISGPIRAENFIYDGLIEALKNSRQHAYPSVGGQWFGVEPGTWFMTGSYDRGNRRLTAAVYDLGVGIPQTLPRTGIWEHVRPFLKGDGDDAEMIAAAMEFGRTRTHLHERGNGLPTMMRILDHHPGYLRIISGTGEVNYDSVKKSIVPTNHEFALGGTLIEWSIRDDR